MSTATPCPDWRGRLSAYHDHQTSNDEARQVEDHLAGCAGCQSALAAWEADRSRFTAAYAGSTGGVALRTAVLEEIRTMTPSQGQIALSLRAYRWLLGFSGLAMTGCIVLAALLALRMPFENPVASLAQPSGITESLSPVSTAPEVTLQYKDDFAHAKKPYMPAEARNEFASDSTRMSTGARKGAVDKLAAGAPAAAPASRVRNSLAEADAVDTTGLAGPALGRNFGAAGGVTMAYDVSYRVEVKEALIGARQAQDAVKQHGGFTMDFSYNTRPGEIPSASFHGKIPYDQADAVLGEFEKLGTILDINIAGEDLTQQFRQMENQLKYQTGAAAAETKRRYAELGLKHNLVEFTATFLQPTPPEQMTLARLARITKGVLKYAFVALVTLAVILLALTLLIGPFVYLRRLRRQARRSLETPEREETQIV